MEIHLCEFYILSVKHEKPFRIHEEFDENQRSMSRKQTCPYTCGTRQAMYAKASEKMYVSSVSKLRDH